MTTIIQRLKADSLDARKARDAAKSAFLTTLLSEASMPGKNDGNRESSDSEALAVCAKFDKNIAELLGARPGEPTALAERAWLASYLPTKLDESQLHDLIAAIAKDLGLEKIGPKDMGSIMAGLKSRAPGQYDGAMASRLIKALSAG
jgi:uncharacterized protein YqeY